MIRRRPFKRTGKMYGDARPTLGIRQRQDEQQPSSCCRGGHRCGCGTLISRGSATKRPRTEERKDESSNPLPPGHRIHQKPDVSAKNSQAPWGQRAMQSITRLPDLLRAALLVLGLFFCLAPPEEGMVAGMRVHMPMSAPASCENIESPEWPLTYSKYANQTLETKGRTNANTQDLRHECQARGVQSKCHICEDIACGDRLNETCRLQLQGVNSSVMSSNIPSVSDTPWAINGSYRGDFSNPNVTRVCQFTSGGDCLNPFLTDYSNCTLRCWAHNASAGSSIKTSTDAELWDYTATEIWNAPRTFTDGSTYDVGSVPDYNPQGYMFTLVGGASEGYSDGNGAAAKFSGPQDVAVDRLLNVYVADTGNHRIRKVTPAGDVTTIAGSGEEGYLEGSALEASFAYPSGIACYYDEDDELRLLVADRNNHRIRLVSGSMDGTGTVSCFSGRCGNATDSFLLSKEEATPEPGYADGSADVSRFDSPNGLEVDSQGVVYVADTNNHLLRMVDSNGTAFTVAGNTRRRAWQDASSSSSSSSGTVPFAGCPPPCLEGVAGFRDGNLSHARFDAPTDVFLGPNGTVMVVQPNALRMVTLPEVVSSTNGIKSMGEVVTLAGTSTASSSGNLDGPGNEATFSNLFAGCMTEEDEVVYLVDASACRLRRVAPASVVVQNVSKCSTPLTEVLRPSGCSSYDPPTGKRGKTVTSVFGNMHYNRDPYGNTSVQSTHDSDGVDFIGREVKDCVGSPPPDRMDKEFWRGSGLNLVIDDERAFIKEDTGDGSIISLRCPPGCAAFASASPFAFTLQGSSPYSDNSAVCMAALHSGVISDEEGGLIEVTLRPGEEVNFTANADFGRGSEATIVDGTLNLTSSSLPAGQNPRLFTVSSLPASVLVVQTLAGHPSAPLEDSCGAADAFNQPPQEAYMDGPRGVDVYRSSNLSDSTYVYIADSGNHAIRAVSVVCAFPCENGGRCTGLDECECEGGWKGSDCSVPDCGGEECGDRKVCVGGGECACIAGYTGEDCQTPLCIQECSHGECVAPDTCECGSGWFGPSCTVPVCTQTCGNGGNCTAPDTCSCPSQWEDEDCRMPVCEQSCLNGGYCTAPDTCLCPSQWTGYDCSLPVCTQGFFRASFNTSDHDPIGYPFYWAEYTPCDYSTWCNDTNGFDCAQGNRERVAMPAGWGSDARAITGRKTEPNRCMMIELGEDVVTQFSYAVGLNGSTSNARYSPVKPYEWTGEPRLAWHAYNESTEGHTYPWVWEYDREVALVELHNVSQGTYVCANEGNCTSPGVCECAEGWAGFDCRTPICAQGYFEPDQKKFVSGTMLDTELDIFDGFMDNNSVRLQWPYSNPNFTLVWESFINKTDFRRYNVSHGGERYLGPSDWTADDERIFTYQGGYRCSIRAWTAFENGLNITENSNYFSRYMDSSVQFDGRRYTYWEGMEWPPVHLKSPALEFNDSFGNLFVYTDRGFMRDGEWGLTGNAWEAGVCVLEFNRTCPGDPSKETDVLTLRRDVLVQDTDTSFRARVLYDDLREYDLGERRWREEGGECVDQVVRGCYNNGTCVAPNTCECASGWTGFDCSTPLCANDCGNGGNCTLPNICTCARGWEGPNCDIPVCAQDCNNDGVCVAPDVCKCNQWPSEWRDGRAEGGRPLYQKPDGDPQNTGWTGFDCSTPICTQAESFYYNLGSPTDYSTATSSSSGSGSSSGGTNASTSLSEDDMTVMFGGHGFDGSLECSSVRCPAYDAVYTANDGKSFQTGCGWDPRDTGCCYYEEAGSSSSSGEQWTCLKCSIDLVSPHNYTCSGESIDSTVYTDYYSIDAAFFDVSAGLMLCGPNHSPVPYYVDTSTERDNYLYTNHNHRANVSGSRFLCNRGMWEMGDFEGSVDLYSDVIGINSDFGLEAGRHTRINFPNYTRAADSEGGGSGSWEQGAITRGEGVYGCFNGGSCIGPDTCSCADGWDGFDCTTPLCRHRQADGQVSSCENGGICAGKDDCRCITSESVLYKVYEEANRGTTGWTGADCSLPMCIQGYFDPFCTDLDQVPGGEGCYRCANGGNCTAPDHCVCADGWTGYDCRTPVCEVVADFLTRENLQTVDEEMVVAFETDPCGLQHQYDPVEWRGASYSRGNCTLPNECTCMCFAAYSAIECFSEDINCEGAWQDPLVKYRNVLEAGDIFGTRSCYNGYEGLMDEGDHFTSCHLEIKVPSFIQYRSVELIVGFTIGGFFASLFFFCVRRRIRRKARLAKMERRKSRRSSEMSQLDSTKPNAFTNATK